MIEVTIIVLMVCAIAISIGVYCYGHLGTPIGSDGNPTKKEETC